MLQQTQLFLLCWISVVSGKSAESALYEDMVARLSDNDMKQALILVRPVYEQHNPVNVTVRFLLRQILDLDEKHQLLTSYWLKKYVWYNYHMTWIPSDYQGIKRMRFHKTEVWVPDIILLNAIQSSTPAEHSNEYVTVEYDGTITLYEPVIYKNHCPINMTRFPYDTQNCSMKWGSWEYAMEQLDMISEIREMDLSEYIEDQEWGLTHNRVYEAATKFDDATYEDMVYEFLLKRAAKFYSDLIVLPTILLSLLMFAVYWIPAVKPERTSVAVAVFSGFMLLLLVMINIAPPSTDINLGTYYCANIVLVVFSIMFSGLAVAISSKEVFMPRWVRWERLVCCSRQKIFLHLLIVWRLRWRVWRVHIGCA